MFKWKSWISVCAHWLFFPHHWEESVSAAFTPSYYIDQIPPEPLLQAEQSQLSQPLLIGQMLRCLHHLHHPLLDSLHYVHVFLAPGRPELYIALQWWPHQCRVEGKDDLLQLAGNAFPDAAHWLLLAQGHVISSWSTWCPPGHPDLSLQSCFPAGKPPVCTGT